MNDALEFPLGGPGMFVGSTDRPELFMELRLD